MRRDASRAADGSFASLTATRTPRRLDFEYVVLGAGPAGLQMGYFLSKGKHSYRIIERTSRPGSFFETYPRSRELISFNKVHSVYTDPELLLRWDWNSLLTDNYTSVFREFSKRLYPSAQEMLDYLCSYAERHSLHIDYDTAIEHILRDRDGVFVLETATGPAYSARCLIIATGTQLPYVPPIPGIEYAEGYESVSLAPQDYDGQRVLIIGKGNSGFEITERILDATALLHLASPTSLKLAWNTRHPGHIRGHYSRVLDAYQLKMLHGALDCVVDSINPTSRGDYAVTVSYVHAESEREVIVYDRVIRATGFRFDDSAFSDTAKPELTLDDRLPAMTSTWESTNVGGMFFAGNLMQVRDFKTASSPFIDGFRYNIRTLYHLLRQRFDGQAPPGQDLVLRPDVLAGAVIARVSRTSALWAQFGFLADVLVLDEGTGRGKYYYELPVQYVHESALGRANHYYTIMFNWGRWDGDVFNIARHPAHERAQQGVFLHPVVRRFRGGDLLSEHHVLEDLLGMYSGAGETGTIVTRGGRDIVTYHRQEHELPLVRFFERQIRPS